MLPIEPHYADNYIRPIKQPLDKIILPEYPHPKANPSTFFYKPLTPTELSNLAWDCGWLDIYEPFYIDSDPVTNAAVYLPGPPVLIDFLADTGDGTAATFSVFGTVGQPLLKFTDPNITLQRAKHLIIGGDLVYPEPTWNIWEKRFITPFFAAGVCAFNSKCIDDTLTEKALETHREIVEYLKIPSHRVPMVEWAAQNRLWTALLQFSTHASRSGSSSPSIFGESQPKGQSPIETCKGTSERKVERPSLWATFGNHDALDGGHVFQRGILMRENITDFSPWHITQTETFFYFIENHWLFLSVNDQHSAGSSDRDIDSKQFSAIMNFLADASNSNNSFHSAVIIIHQPFWLESEPYPGPLLQTIMDKLFGRLRAVIAGDMHYYAHWAPTQNPLQRDICSSSSAVDTDFTSRLPHLIISGGGGAFLHPTTHVPDRVRLYIGAIDVQRNAQSFPKPGSKTPINSRVGWNYELKQTFPSKQDEMSTLITQLLLKRIWYVVICAIFSILWAIGHVLELLPFGAPEVMLNLACIPFLVLPSAFAFYHDSAGLSPVFVLFLTFMALYSIPSHENVNVVKWLRELTVRNVNNSSSI